MKMGKISDISKKYKSEVETAKKSDFETRYQSHYASVVLPHLRELDDTFNSCVSELRKRLEEEKNAYILEQKSSIESQVDVEYNAFLNSIDKFIDKE